MLRYKKPTVSAEWKKRIRSYLNSQVELSFYPVVENAYPQNPTFGSLSSTIGYVTEQIDKGPSALPRHLLFLVERDDFRLLQSNQGDTVLILDPIHKKEHLRPKQRYTVQKALNKVSEDKLKNIQGALFVSEDLFRELDCHDKVDEYVHVFRKLEELLNSPSKGLE